MGVPAFGATLSGGTLTAAAAARGISQPAISMHLKVLDGLYGTPLMERQGRGVRPTAAGQLVAEYTRRIVALVDELGRAVDDVKELRAGELRLGASATIGETLLPRILGSFRKAYPGIELVLRIGNTRSIVQAVRARALGLGIVGAAAPDAELESTPVLDDCLEIFVGADSELLGRAPVPLENLAAETFVVRESGSATRDAALARFGCSAFHTRQDA